MARLAGDGYAVLVYGAQGVPELPQQIADILEEPRAEAIVRSTVDLARNLGLTVVAEGIETEAVLSHLVELGCDTGQGYLISRPQPADALTPILKTGVAAVPVPPGFNNALAKLIRSLVPAGNIVGKDPLDGGVIQKACERRVVR